MSGCCTEKVCSQFKPRVNLPKEKPEVAFPFVGSLLGRGSSKLLNWVHFPPDSFSEWFPYLNFSLTEGEDYRNRPVYSSYSLQINFV